MEIVEEFPIEQVDELMKAEEFHINYLKFLGAPLTNSTEKSFGVVEHTPEAIAKMQAFQASRSAKTNEKISNSLKGRKMPAEQYEKFLNRINSPEWKAKMSKVHKGKTLTEEQKQYLSKIQLGSKKSEETKRKIAESMKGKIKTAEHVEKIAAFNRGRKLGPQTPEQIAKRMAAKRATMEAKKLQLVIQP